MRKMIWRGCVFALALHFQVWTCLSAVDDAGATIPPDDAEEVYSQDSNNKFVDSCELSDEASPKCSCQDPLDSVGTGQTDLDCAWIKIGTGAMRPGTSLGPGYFQLKAETPSPDTATPSALHYVLGYEITEISKERTAAGLPGSVTLINNYGFPIAFKFDDDESVGIPFVGEQSKLEHRLMMVDAEGWATTNNPAYYDLYPGDGEMYRFIAATNSSDYLELDLYRGKTGREETMATIDTEIIKDADSNIRQVLAPSCLADVVVSNACKYSINFYHRSEVQSEKDENGLYVPQTGASLLGVWIIENPDPSSANNLRVTKVNGSYTNTSD